jgi:hypothetical protein
MASDYSRYQQGIIKRYYEHRGTIVVQRLGELVTDITLAETEAQKKKLWVRVRQTLLRLDSSNQYFHAILENRDAEELARCVTALTGGAEASAVKGSASPAGAASAVAEDGPAADGASNEHEQAGEEITEAQLKAALRAYKKRLKLMRLNDESRIGGSKLTSGRHSEIDAIIPPSQFPRVVWDELAKQGKLKYTGQGFYQLV